MQKEYICDGIVKYTLSTGKEVTLSVPEMEELIESSEIIEDLKSEIVQLEHENKCLQDDLDLSNDIKDEQISIINKLEKEIDKLEQNK
jgi:cell shape-determining protein MreC